MFRFGFRRRRSPKTYRVSSPDGSTLTFQLEGRVTGQELLTRSLEESQASGDPDYFGLASYEGNFVKWIVLNKPLKKQLSGKSPFQLHLRVQVYPLDYHSLSQPTSRHMLVLQLRRDLLENRFSCEEDKLVWMLGLVVQADVGDYSAASCDAGYLGRVDLMPRLTNSLEQQIHTQHKMNRGKPAAACQEELLGEAQLEAAYGIISYQVQDASRNPVTMTAAPSGVQVLRGMMATNNYLWHTIVKISHKSRRLYLHISSQDPGTGHPQFTCSSSSMAANMVHHLGRLQASYTSTHTQGPSRLQRFFSSRRSVRVLKPLSRPKDVPSSNPLQRHSFAGEAPNPALLNHTSLRLALPSPSPPPPKSTPHTITTHVELEGRRGHQCHTHSDSYSSRHSGVEGHSRQESGLSNRSHHSALVDPLSPSDPALHPRQGSVISQLSHHSSPSREFTVSAEPAASPLSNITTNYHGSYYNQDMTHSTPIKANSAHREVWQVQSSPAAGYTPPPSFGRGSQNCRDRESPYGREISHRGSPFNQENGHRAPYNQENGHSGPLYGRENGRRGSPYGRNNGHSHENGHQSPHKAPRGSLSSGELERGKPSRLVARRGSSEGRGAWKDAEPSGIPDFIPEEGGGLQLYPSRHRHHSARVTPPRQQASLTVPEFQTESPKSSTFPREGSSLSQPEGHMDSVVDLLDEALEVLDEEEDQRKEKERQRAQKPWKPQHRGRFRLSLQDSSYYDYRLYNSYRHFNRNRAFHGSKHSSSTTHLSAANDPAVDMVASAQLQESLVELSQASDTAIDPHIRSFVFEGSQTETGEATEL